MEDCLRDIVKGCNNRSYQRAEEKDFSDEYGKTRVYKVGGDEKTLFFWNSSNSKSIDFDEVLPLISNEILDGNEEGEVDDGWNSIMFETKNN